MAKDDPGLTTQDPFSQAEQPQLPVAQTPFERLNTGSGSSMIDQAVQRDFQQRQAQANLYQKNAADIHGLLFHLADPEARKSYLNPKTGQPYTDSDMQELQDQLDHATGQYEKLVGVDKESKGALQKAKTIIDFVHGRRRAAMQPPPTPDYPTTVSDAGVSTTGVNTPRQGPVAQPSSYATNVGDTGVSYDPSVANKITPPPLSPRQEAIRSSLQMPFATHQAKVGQALQDTRQAEISSVQTRQELVKKVLPQTDWNKPYVQDFVLTGHITGNMGAALRPPPRPVGSYTTSVLDARSRASKTGEVFLNVAGEPIPIDELDDSMGLKGMQTLDPTTGQWQVRYEPFSPNQSTVTADNQVFAVNPMDKSKIPSGAAGTVVGAHTVPSTTKTTSPETGQTTVSTKTPQTGRPGAAAITPPPTISGAPGVAKPAKPVAPGGAGPQAKAVPPHAALPALDENGHIPASVVPASTPQIVEGANQLLDGKDVKDLPAKTKELSANMARRYGWEQGKFTPREQGALRNATQFIDDMLSDPSTFAVLDDTLSRLKLNQVLAGAHTQGTIASAASTLAAKNMSDQEAKFVRQYNIITQTLAGIAPAIRGSGNRTTEAAIQRLLTDMPNPKTVQGAKDGMDRLQLLKKEVSRALAKGQFTEVDAAADTSKGKITPPPTVSGAQLSPAARKYLESQGIKVP